MKIRILVIDDEEHICSLLADVLESAGYQVKTVNRGKDGLNFFQSGNYDLVITDHGMPGMSGIEVAKEIKKIKPATPVILLTGLNFNFHEDGVNKERNFDLLLNKPFQLSSVLATVKKALKIKEDYNSMI